MLVYNRVDVKEVLTLNKKLIAILLTAIIVIALEYLLRIGLMHLQSQMQSEKIQELTSKV